MFQMQLVRYGNDHNILHIHDNILPICSETWVSKSVISLLLLGRIITGNNNSDLLPVNDVFHRSTSIHVAHVCTPVAPHQEMETPYGDQDLAGSSRSPLGAFALFMCSWSLTGAPERSWALNRECWEREGLGQRRKQKRAASGLFLNKGPAFFLFCFTLICCFGGRCGGASNQKQSLLGFSAEDRLSYCFPSVRVQQLTVFCPSAEHFLNPESLETGLAWKPGNALG